MLDLQAYGDFLLQEILRHPKLVEYRDDVEIEHPEQVDGDIVVICCGYGQKQWDSTIYPILGETLLVDAPNAPRDKAIGAVMNDCSGNAVPIPGHSSKFIVGASKRAGVESSSDDSHHQKVFELACRVMEELQGGTILEQRECRRIASDSGALVRQWFSGERKFIEAGRLGGFGWTISFGLVNHILIPMIVSVLHRAKD